MHVGLAFKHEEELTVRSFDSISTDNCVRFEAVDCTLAKLFGGIVGAFVYIVAVGVVERIKILLRAVFLVNVLDDVLTVNDGLVKSCDLFGGFAHVLGCFECRKRRSDFLDNDFLILVGVESFEFRLFCRKFLCKRG